MFFCMTTTHWVKGDKIKNTGDFLLPTNALCNAQPASFDVLKCVKPILSFYFGTPIKGAFIVYKVFRSCVRAFALKQYISAY